MAEMGISGKDKQKGEKYKVLNEVDANKTN